MEGVPDEPVPEHIANELQPYVTTLQKKDGFAGEIQKCLSLSQVADNYIFRNAFCI